MFEKGIPGLCGSHRMLNRIRARTTTWHRHSASNHRPKERGRGKGRGREKAISIDRHTEKRIQGKYLFTDNRHGPHSEGHDVNGGRETALESRTCDKCQEAYATNGYTVTGPHTRTSGRGRGGWQMMK